MPAVHIEVHRAAHRFATESGGLRSRHCLSFGRHYDPANTSHGLLLASNDVVVQPGAGFDTHAHRDMEIVTWVLQGSLVHEDSAGHRGVVSPGLAQRMSAGSGVLHSERNEADEPVRFVRMWVAPQALGGAPGYEQGEVDDAALSRLTVVASGRDRHDAAVRIGQRDAALHVGKLGPGQQVQLPDAPYLHLFVAQGRVALEGAGALDEGDAVRISGAGGQRLKASTDTQILVWELHSSLP